MKKLMFILVVFLSACGSKKNVESERKKEKTVEEIVKEWQQQNQPCAYVFDCMPKQKIQFDMESVTVFAPTGVDKEALANSPIGTRGGLPAGTYLRDVEKADNETSNYLERFGHSELTVFKSNVDVLVCQSFEGSSSLCVFNKNFLVSMNFKIKPAVGALIEVGIFTNTIKKIYN